MKVLYLKGSRSEIDVAVTQQLLTIASDLAITPVASPAEALVEVRKTAGWQALLVSPTLSQNDTLALIASLRRDRAPIAIVPVVDETHQDRYAAAVSSGADDVLMRRGQSLVNVAETIERIRQSPHAFPTEPRRRLGVLYAGRDALVWSLLDQIPFVRAERVTCGADGACPVRVPGAGDGTLRCDAVVIDEQPGDAHPLQVLKSVKGQASDLPVIVLTSTGAADIATAALELGADDTVLKTGIFRRRLIATLRRAHQKLELQFQQAEIKAREERLRHIIENVPAAIAVVAGDGAVLAMNAEALRLVGAARPREVVGRDFRTLVTAEHHESVTDLLRRVTKGETAALTFEAETLAGQRVGLQLRGTLLERDAKGTRGMIASLAPVSPDPPEVASPGESPAEAAEMAMALGELERQLESVRAERARESAERQAVEQQADELRQMLQERAVEVQRLEQAAAELRTQTAALLEEQRAWQQTGQVLRATTEQLEASHQRVATLESAIDAAHDELRRLAESRDRTEEAWAAARQTLEARVGDAERAAAAARDQQAAALAAAEHETQRLASELEAERAAWEAARETWARQHAALEAAVGNRESVSASERAAWDAERAQLAADKAAAEQALEALRAAGAEWQRTREHLEGVLREREAAIDAERAAAERTREQMDTALRERDDRLDAERSDWQRTRDLLEHALAEREAAAAAERAEWQHTREETERAVREAEHAARALQVARDADRQALESASAELKALHEALDVARQHGDHTVAEERAAWVRAREEWDAARRELERAIHDRDAALDRERGNHDEHRRRLEGELGQLGATLDAERAAWHDSRQHLEAELGDLRGRLSAAEGVQSALDAARAERHQAETSWAAERGGWDERRSRLEGELGQLRATLEHDRAAWHESRRQLEGQLADLEHRLSAAEALRPALDAARTALQQLEEARAAEQSDRDRERAAWNDERAAWTGERTAWEVERHDWERTSSDWERERDGWARERADLEELRREIEQAFADADARQADERRAWTDARHQLEREAAEAASLRETRQHLEEALIALQVEHGGLVDALAAERSHRERDARELTALRTTLDEHERLRAVAEARVLEAEQDADRREAAVEARCRILDARLADIRRRVEEADREVARLRAALEREQGRSVDQQSRLMASPLVAYALTTRDGRIRQCNDTFAKLFGYTGASALTTRHGAEPFEPLAGRAEVEAALSFAGAAEPADSCLERPDGRAIRVRESATLVPDGDTGEPLVERLLVAVEAPQPLEALQAARLEEVGAFATSMAPDLERLIADVHQRARDLRGRLDGEADAEAARACAKLAAQAAGLARQLATFGRRHVGSVAMVNLNETIHQAEPMLAQLVGEYIGFEVRLGAATSLAANTEDLDQLLTSLVTFGRDMLPAGGSLLLETAPVAPGHPAASHVGPGARLSLTASGYGVQAPDVAPALDRVVRQAGGDLQMSGEPGWQLRMDVHFSRCGRRGSTSASR